MLKLRTVDSGTKVTLRSDDDNVVNDFEIYSHRLYQHHHHCNNLRLQNDDFKSLCPLILMIINVS